MDICLFVFLPSLSPSCDPSILSSVCAYWKLNTSEMIYTNTNTISSAQWNVSRWSVPH